MARFASTLPARMAATLVFLLASLQLSTAQSSSAALIPASISLLGFTTIAPPATGGTGYVIGPSGTTPFYSAPSTFTPTATGATAGPGTEVTITNASPTGLFSFTRPFSSVPPSGTITDSSAIAEATSLDGLQPTPKGLQSAPAGRSTPPLGLAGASTPLLLAGAIAWISAVALLAGQFR